MEISVAMTANAVPEHGDGPVERFFLGLPAHIRGDRLAILELAEKEMPEHLNKLVDEFIEIENDLKGVSQRQPIVMREVMLMRGIDLDIRDDTDRVVHFVLERRRHRPMR